MSRPRTQTVQAVAVPRVSPAPTPWYRSWVRVGMLAVLVAAIVWLGWSFLHDYKTNRPSLLDCALGVPVNGVVNGLCAISIVAIVMTGIWHSLHKFDPDRHAFKFGWLEFGGGAEAKELADLKERARGLEAMITARDQAIARHDTSIRNITLNWSIIVDHIALLKQGAAREQIVHVLNTICSACVDALPGHENLKVTVWLASNDRKKIRVRAAHGVPVSNRTFLLVDNKGFAAKVVSTGTAKVISSWENVSDDDFVINPAHKRRPKSIIGCESSIMIDAEESRAVAALCISEDGPDNARRFTDADMPVVRFYAQAVSTVLSICKRMGTPLT